MIRILYISQKDRTKELKHFAAEMVTNGVDFHWLFVDSCSDIESHVKAIKPTHILIHHNRGLLSAALWRKLAKECKLIWWVNDERYPIPEWIKGLIGVVDTWLVSSKDSQRAIQELGGKANYLIMGFNPKKKQSNERDLNLVFTGQNSGDIFPLSEFRKTVIQGLKNHIGDDFKLYGKGWVNADAKQIDSGIYARAKIGLSVGHFDTEGTYSNRVLQIMSNGALCLVHNRKGLSDVFGDNVVYFEDVKDAFEKYLYYIKHESERKYIAEKGRTFVDNNLTWKHKAKDILACM
jgi:glycosyltransferase involved in cell wall biosynthesis